ncbi:MULTISPECIES: 16S rRNA (cytosine(1402)-N(4))-methyltransferase RsmH [Pseudobutyrivibrio]|uniref:Ribosomal RNA small subunit methyltransferase H n=2 Tax=Pseudobutyrivibrio ruminis TaxID=46206 RepID=A0A1H7IT91_9FIRM|nr:MULTISPECIES: 16S rRNA (cytosine(1402)-N(4))-methyltransferase RsmH [Pseudobutyrivibrio]SEK65494.1 16S rRNA (cytosine1402-N4)-methyltransferase [Pseudobutyrivibrio ruminis]SES76284.1 16S rRNA (cytosine1402-N4)-methyltransferase [Pseudobutyrivibrio sp. C4]SFO21597.1 16S rRNA (cytosine1402-N4)-methyltransferase [Pseudobutyrivibrio sp. JW11]SOB97113.1 16S rRNA (cytosine1402-N4)-methyltransferase [Pseudobutyrivibrio ruminis DSM 9787]
MEFNHYSVLLNETIDNLNIKPDGIYVDGTLGGGGHSYEIAKRLTTGHLYGFDQDTDALKAAGERLKEFGDKVTRIHSNYEFMKEKLLEQGVTKVDGIMLDLGVSSFQLDEADRGFTYRVDDAPLDMRMDKDNPMTAADIVNTYSAEDLTRVLFTYGEEKFSKQIVKNIIKQREIAPILTAGQLNKIIAESIPKKAQVGQGHPSKRTYQALRIELNRELTVLEDHIDDMIDLLNPDGRLCIITFHSLEDRITKVAFKRNEDPCTCPKDFPVCVCGKKSKGKVVTRKPILPSEKELEENSRSKSAKLRVFERKDS